eukprot:6201122-Pleurochrysis_carterae.AAC.6
MIQKVPRTGCENPATLLSSEAKKSAQALSPDRLQVNSYPDQTQDRSMPYHMVPKQAKATTRNSSMATQRHALNFIVTEHNKP